MVPARHITYSKHLLEGDYLEMLQVQL